MEKLSPERWQQIDDLFAAALDLPPAEREAFVDAACGHDPELARRVRKLVADAAAAELALGESVSEFAEPLLPGLQAELQGEETAALPADGRIGPYRILREIGRGGMGAVYLAERADEQFRKQVALKLVKRGMDTDEVLQRFRYERQILASLEHPNVARLYDGGATDDGRPYLVMEYIEGRPLTAYCDERRLPVRERLRLFATVCGAVQFAHRNLVIHRDLKPSNILVTTEGTVKLLDFGIAKLLNPSDPEDAPLTRPEMRLLTPEYAAPEQLEGAPVTTASDVYALGVVLYELLTGRRPFDRRDGRASDRGRFLGDVERPSTAALRPLPARPDAPAPPSPAQIAATRATTPDRLRRILRGDLDTIARKALAEEPDQRYQSAEQLLADIQRYLNGLPVLARGDSLGYRTRKFVRRHRIATTLGTALVVLVAGSTTTTLIQAREVARARAVAEARQAQAEDLIGFMLGDLRGKLVPIGRLDVLNDVGTKALEYFASVPEEELSDQELFRRSEALRLLGQVQLDQGNTEAAARTFRESLTLAEGLARRDSLNGSWQLGLGASLYWLGFLNYSQQDARGALEYWRRYHRITERLVRHAPDDPTYRLELSYAHGNIGTALEALADREGALREYRLTLEQKQRLVELDPANAEFRAALAVGFNKVAVAQRRQGDLRSALENHQAELAAWRDIVARDTSDAQALRALSRAHTFLGDVLMAVGKDAEGLHHVLEAWRLQQSLVARDSNNAAWRLELAVGARIAGAAMVRAGQGEAGLEPLGSSRAILRELVGASPGNVAYRQHLGRTETHLAAAHRLLDRPDEAHAASERALAVIAAIRVEGGVEPEPLRVESEAYLELGRALARLGRSAQAREAWVRALAAIRPVIEESSTTDYLATYCTALLLLDRLDEARPVAEILLQREYRRSDFLELARAKGILSRTD